MESGLENQCVVSIANVNNVVPRSCEAPSLFIQDVIAVCERVLQRSLPGYKVGELSTENANAESK